MAARSAPKSYGWLLVLLAAAGLAASCGGSPSPSPAPGAAPTEEPGATPAPVSEPPPAESSPPPAVESPATAESPAAPSPAPEPASVPKPLSGLPRFTAGYEDWLRLNEDPIPPREGGDAHLSIKNVYTSMEAMRSGGTLEYPVGTVIVKEGIRPGTDFIGLIATMRKVEGADPDHNDWVFVEWARDNADAPFKELARDATCWGCHGDTAKTDYVWVHTLGTAP